MERYDFVAVDVETATTSRMICQIGIAAVKDGQIVERISRLVQPPLNKYDNMCIAVHHIKPEQTINEPTFDIVWEDIKKYFINQRVVSHTKFDYDALMKNFNHYGMMEMGIYPFEDTYEIFPYKIEVACEMYGISCCDHHDACNDAVCCAELFIKYLNDEKPIKSFEEAGGSSAARPRNRSRRLKGDIFVKDLEQANPESPFYDRKVVITGEFEYDRATMQLWVKRMGGDLDSQITKKTHFVIIGSEPGPAKMEKVDKLIHDGFNIRLLYERDVKNIMQGIWEPYRMDGENRKELNFTIDHFNLHHVDMSGFTNNIARKNLYYGKGIKGNMFIFCQIAGNLGACGDFDIYEDTDICVLSDDTLEKLNMGVKDETTKYIEDTYNNNKSIVFDFQFVSESDILQFAERRNKQCGDEVTQALCEKYIASCNK